MAKIYYVKKENVFIGFIPGSIFVSESNVARGQTIGWGGKCPGWRVDWLKVAWWFEAMAISERFMRFPMLGCHACLVNGNCPA